MDFLFSCGLALRGLEIVILIFGNDGVIFDGILLVFRSGLRLFFIRTPFVIASASNCKFL